MSYKHDDGERYVTTYGQLREWADGCEDVKEWMEDHIPQAFLQDDAEARETIGDFRSNPFKYLTFKGDDQIWPNQDLLDAMKTLHIRIPSSLYPMTNVRMLAQLFKWFDENAKGD